MITTCTTDDCIVVLRRFTSFASLPFFAGVSSEIVKQDTNYDLGRYKVECLKREQFRKEVIDQTIRRSLKGEAGHVIMRIGKDATGTKILDKMESIFGTLAGKMTIADQFYNS